MTDTQKGRQAALIEQLSQLKVGELASLVDALQESWGVEPTVTLRPPEPIVEPEHERRYKLVLNGLTGTKVAFLRALRTLEPETSIARMRELLEQVPVTLREDLGLDEAEALAGKLREGGADVGLQ